MLTLLYISCSFIFCLCYITGVPETVNKLKEDYGLKIGCSTGFVRSMVDILIEQSTKAGYKPDCSVAADEVPQVNNVSIHVLLIYIPTKNTLAVKKVAAKTWKRLL